MPECPNCQQPIALSASPPHWWHIEPGEPFGRYACESLRSSPSPQPATEEER